MVQVGACESWHPGLDHPRNTESGDGTAVRVTVVPTRYECSQYAVVPGPFEQSASGGLTRTEPEPFSMPSTSRYRVCGPRNLAIAPSTSFIRTVQVGACESWHPGLDHPRNTESGDGTAVRVTVVPTRYECWQYAVVSGPFEHSSSGGLTRTEPDPPSTPSTLR